MEIYSYAIDEERMNHIFNKYISDVLNCILDTTMFLEAYVFRLEIAKVINGE